MQGMIIHRSVHDKALLCIYSFAVCSVNLLCGIEWLQNICFGDVYVKCELLKRSLSVLNLPCVHLQQSPPASETCRRNTSRPSWSKSVLVASTTSTVLTHLTHYIQNYKHIFINFPKWNTVYSDEGFYIFTSPPGYDDYIWLGGDWNGFFNGQCRCLEDRLTDGRHIMPNQRKVLYNSNIPCRVQPNIHVTLTSNMLF